MTPEKILATVLALLAAEPAEKAFPVIAAGGADPAYPVRIEACPRPLPATEVEGKTVICGRISVPERHETPEGARIELAFAVLKARTESPAPDPLIYLHGGPGGGAVRDLAGIVVPLWDSYRARRDVVTFDQRAAGISSDMVTCFQTAGANVIDLFHPERLDDAKIDSFMPACLEEVKASGRDISACNTVQTAQDVRAPMRGLGYDSYNIYGVSYGTKLGMEVMRTAPEGVRSVVLDSVFPPNARAYDTNILPVQEGVQKVVEGCAAVSTEARGAMKPIVDILDLMVVACQEDMPFNSREGMQAVVAGLDYPFLAQSSYVDGTAFDICQFLPPALPTPGFHDPVRSDIPTLVLYGWNDTQTATAEALLAASTLERAQALGFPEAGHGALIFSQCAKDIGLAFVERPGEALATGCIERLKPVWMLPPATP